MIGINRIAFLLVLSSTPLAFTYAAAAGSDAPSAVAGDWIDVTNNVGGENWGAYGITYMKAVPGSDMVIAGVSECGLWRTDDGGATWKKLGGAEIKNRPGRIVFDPKDPAVFWVSGCYGDAPFKTEDGGKTFQRLGNLTHADGVDVDFSDPQRKTLLLGLHEQSQSLQLSTDGGKSWKKIGDKLPADSNHSSDPIIIDSKTFLTNTAGWKPKARLGIYRTENAGETWTVVSEFGPAGEPLVACDGAIYWQRLWGGGLLKSTDKGKTWSVISNAIKSNPIELPGKRLAGLAESQVLVSSDGGVKWTKIGPPAPFKPNGITYSEKGRCFYAWRLADNLKKSAQSIVRMNAE
jgi:photosystem II stability/assembly factor-like uncharacterized protein